jgi:hypothetical protein
MPITPPRRGERKGDTIFMEESFNSNRTIEILQNMKTFRELATAPCRPFPAGDMVNHPAHYKTANGLEAIDVIEAFTEGLQGGEATNTGNVLKYMCRWKKKNGLEDLKKARWYLDRLIKAEEKKEEKEEENPYEN